MDQPAPLSTIQSVSRSLVLHLTTVSGEELDRTFLSSSQQKTKKRNASVYVYFVYIIYFTLMFFILVVFDLLVGCRK